MNEDSNARLKSLVMLVDDNSFSSNDISTHPESKNLESICWYLKELSQRAIDNQHANAEAFAKAAKLAEKSLSELISALNNQ